MRIAVVGGGPGGLYLAALAKQLGPHHEITVWERNAHDDTFGFGVVFSDETLGGIEQADRVVHDAMQREFARWDDIDVHYRGEVVTSGGHGFAAMDRRRLLAILRDRCDELGVSTRFRCSAPDVGDLAGAYDLVVAADGVNSGVRGRYADTFGTSLEQRNCKYIWLGTDKVFEAFTFDIRQTPAGVMQLHGYPYSATGSTFIVEMHDSVWHRAGFAEFAADATAPGESDERSVAVLRDLFADLLDGRDVLTNNSKWLNFTTVRNDVWRNGNVVLIGDAAHTAHFSIGSGTKLAMEDALALAACLHEQAEQCSSRPTEPLDNALAAYEEERRPVVLSTQRAAQASLEWFENIEQYMHQEPTQFAFNLLTRSRRITHDNLRVRDAEYNERVERWFADRQAPPMFQPFRLGGLELKNRVVVSAMDMYSSVDGVPGDFHLVHLGSKALGGAAMVMTEMVCVSSEGRITPGCAGLYDAEQERSWTRIVRFAHEQSTAAIGVQLGHSGRKGSTKLMWEGMDEPLPEDNWPVAGPSAIPYGPGNQTPRELTRADMDGIRDQFVAAALRAARAGFDFLELHCAHGYLLSSFISPLSNRRTDAYGGCLANRLRYPLEVFDAVRSVWPDDRPMGVRISATDWYEGGIDADDAVEIAAAFAEHGADLVDTSTGQVVHGEHPAFGRSYQTPFADRIRNTVGVKHDVAVMAVGAIASWDDVNSILLAGRADLCAVGRPHLYDPHWTLHAAAEQEYTGPGAEWVAPYRAGSRRPPTGRTDGPKPRLDLVRRGTMTTRHDRWRPGGSRA